MSPEETPEEPQTDVTEPAAPAEKDVKAKAKPVKAAAKAKAEASDAEQAGEEPKADAAPAGKKAAAKKAPAAEKKASEKKATAKKAEDASAETATSEAAASESKPAAGKAAPKAARRRVVSAHARYVRTSARKARMVCGHIRGKSVEEARAILAFTPREVARDWSKLLESAVANAESNHELLEDDLIVREAYADEGPTIKRFRPRAMGRATPIRKRTSHLTITLTPRPEPGNTKRHG
jgi:ribosomal protein L22